MNALDSQATKILVFMRDLLSNPEKWTREAYARKADKTTTSSSDPQAVCFCLSGALGRSYAKLNEFSRYAMFTSGGPHISAESLLLEAIYVSRGQRCHSLAEFNDVFATHETILEVIDLAIERSRVLPVKVDAICTSSTKKT